MKRFMLFISNPWFWQPALVILILVGSAIIALNTEDPTCTACKGFGYLSRNCSWCSGSGEYYRGDYHVGHCQHCYGTGQGKCCICDGTGKRR